MQRLPASTLPAAPSRAGSGRPFPALRIGRLALLAAALGAGVAHAAPATTPLTARSTASPDQPAPRNGDYRVLKIGQKAIQAKCTEGGTVVVAAHPAASSRGPATKGGSRVHGITAERDTAIRSACKAVDYTK